MLRNPAAAELAADSGCIDSCVEAMQACERDNFSDSATGTQWVLRQVCASVIARVLTISRWLYSGILLGTVCRSAVAALLYPDDQVPFRYHVIASIAAMEPVPCKGWERRLPC